MIIVVEGPDNAGKTTLATLLAKKLKGVYIKTEMVPAKNEDLEPMYNLLSVAWSYSQYVISDRHAAISEPIYGEVCRGGHELKIEDATHALSRIHLIIYCRPPTKTILASIDERPQMAGVIEHTREIIDCYDNVMAGATLGIPQIVYDYTVDEIDNLVTRIRGMEIALDFERPIVGRIDEVVPGTKDRHHDA